ncbi:O-antigen ligase [Rhodococcus sp. JVH1]|uniref:O-antigen ligase family protein n=1 Tax=Rhodococcus sp. JVH1 TaxID=745408 RepID=UPI0009FFC6B2|nr:O-antigen ligase family protein [Rhodococcus sp. JVH1]
MTTTKAGRIDDLLDRKPGEVSRWPAVVAVVAAFLIPVFDTIGAGPILLALIGIVAIWTLPNAPRIGVNLAVAGVIIFGLSIALYEGGGRGNYFYDVGIVLGVAPCAYLLGRRLGSANLGQVYVLRAVIILSLVGVIVGILEYLESRYLISNSLFSETPTRNGQFRSRGLFPQSLVLALFCAVSIPLTFDKRVVSRTLLRVLTVMVLALGIYTTASRGAPLALFLAGVVWLICYAVTTKSARIAFSLFAILVGFVALLVGSGNPFSGNQTSLVTSSDGAVASAQYRAELYRQVLPVVAEKPFGFGLGRVPEHIIVFHSYFGTLDASRTVDSEYVLGLLKFGLVGLVFYLYLWYMVVRRLSERPTAVGFALVVLLFSGVFLALQSWLTVVFILPLLFGLQIGEVGRAGARAS